MTSYGWDSSHHDWSRGPMDISAAVRDGIAFMTHKVGEGRSFVDDRFDDFYRRARAAQVQLLGAYYVNHPGDQVAQADRFLSLLDARAPGWRDGPFVLQVDAEKFDYMDRAPNLTEIRAFCGRLVARTNARFRPVVYAPRWLYGDGLRGLGYPLWASSYGSNPIVHYRTAYPGDNSTRWAAYSGQTPAILQYGSRTRIGSQNTCDANAFRGTLAQLRALVHPPSKEIDMDATQDRLLRNVERIVTTGWSNRDAFGVNYGDGQDRTLANPFVGLNKKLDATATAVAALAADVAELKARPEPGTVVVTDEQLERVLRRVLGSVDGASPAAQ